MAFPAILGTVVLAGVNPSGEPKFIDGTYLVAGVDADGVAHILGVDDDGNLGASSLTKKVNQLSADVAMANANQYYDGPSLSLEEGTWLLVASVLVRAPGAGTGIQGKIWDGTTPFASAEYSVGANTSYQLSMTTVVTPTSTTTYRAAVACVTAGATIKAQTVQNASGNTASTLVAVKIA